MKDQLAHANASNSRLRTVEQSLRDECDVLKAELGEEKWAASSARRSHSVQLQALTQQHASELSSRVQEVKAGAEAAHRKELDRLARAHAAATQALEQHASDLDTKHAEQLEEVIQREKAERQVSAERHAAAAQALVQHASDLDTKHAEQLEEAIQRQKTSAERHATEVKELEEQLERTHTTFQHATTGREKQLKDLEAKLAKMAIRATEGDREKMAKMRLLEELKAEAEERAREASQLALELAGVEQEGSGGRPGPSNAEGWTQTLGRKVKKFAKVAWGLFTSANPYQARRLTEGDTKFAALATLMKVEDPHNLGIGRDVAVGPWKVNLDTYPDGDDGKARSLKLAAAWQLHNSELLGKYRSEGLSVKRDMVELKKHFPDSKFDRSLETLTSLEAEFASSLCVGVDPGSLDGDINEHLLLHATKPEFLHQLLCRGPSEKFCQGLFGQGVYFAEILTKNDQYTTVDSRYHCAKELNDLHAELYPNARDHPGDVRYVIVCRVLMGCYTRTQKLLHPFEKMDHEDMGRAGESVWFDGGPGSSRPPSRRQLKAVPGGYPGARIHYHSLVAEKLPRDQGGVIERHREFLQFHHERVYPAYLLAYRRILDGNVCS